MTILFITLAYPKLSERNLYSDLMEEFVNRGHEVFVACQTEKREGIQTHCIEKSGVHVLRIRTGNITKAGILEKGISTFRLQGQFSKSVRKFPGFTKLDLILYSTPPITFARLIRQLKQQHQAKTYLLLKDIFPQNAVDLQLIKKNGFLHQLFRRQEKSLYHISDHIGCMSQANVDYVLAHNPEVSPHKIEICPNSIRPSELQEKSEDNRKKIREKLGIPIDSILFIYGGNLGKPQGASFIIKTLHVFEENPSASLLIVGSGTEFGGIRQAVTELRSSRVKVLQMLPKSEYDDLLRTCDAGLIYLDSRFTIPNFPSRLTAYLDYGIPILAATDKISDIKDAIIEGNFGAWVEAGDIESFRKEVSRIIDDEEIRILWSANAKAYLLKNYTVEASANVIMSHIGVT